ncbi:YcxB family protein [Flavobacterium foetidum]|uniref:YcxB family protein n=1 Tax=Flavobacterium foetidum TaxID=2026681 RepID=UPI0010757366|nr:YcxB family protein [Flavobacterium foetidum]KAF2515577.1 YcxB family protein [Flavobacterium foetidum]
MNSSNFSMEFELNGSEIRKLNKMYFENIYRERVTIISCLVLFVLIVSDFLNTNEDNDLIIWIIKTLIIIVFFLLIQYSIVETVCKIIFRLAKKLLRFDNFIRRYKFNFTNSLIYVHSPLGEFKHDWSKIDKAILTKDFFLLYIKERNGYIISISNKDDSRDLNRLLDFVEKNVTHIIKV